MTTKLYYSLMVLLLCSCTASQNPRTKTTTGYFYQLIPRDMFAGDMVQLPTYTYAVNGHIYYRYDRTGYRNICDSLPVRYDSLHPQHAKLVMNDTAFYRKK